jgi:hypothetical protein
MSRWYTGDGKGIEFSNILAEIGEHTASQGVVYIGTDSFLNSDCCTFATAIVLHGATGQRGGTYFFTKNRVEKRHYDVLVARVTQEVNLSVQMAMAIKLANPAACIEVHLDISASNKKAATSKYSDMLVGYVKGAGFRTKIKPDAFAAASVADKHSK